MKTKSIYKVCKMIKVVAESQVEASRKFFNVWPDYQGPIIVQWECDVPVAEKLPVRRLKGMALVSSAFSTRRRAAVNQ